ncbi:MAG: hypothetical protein HZB55_16905 [Deltaproteobacteria bacterium]|nr:hypothetical protein [Deltaproteobacteria bacterium]
MRREQLLAVAAAVSLSWMVVPGWTPRGWAQAPETRPTTAESREQYAARVEKEIKGLGARIEELTKKAEAAGGSARKASKRESKKVLEELKAKKEALERKLGALKLSTGRAWRDLKSGLDEALEDVHKSLERAKNRFP